ncbi:hypothetical protein K488DRAFT_60806 [Vararia minispora EC-137]|uniref:Uncharacterized protein n=1 Tax=Vararia minispora EC-137 TaxID=1314806 RepID=A0ACB8Q782_9AGAM|nr:hypothetical protein K488DRAFT_60806 [Vararia minispora EC-137]
MRRFLYHQLNLGQDSEPDNANCPEITGRVHVFHSATATFYAPSDESGQQGMRCEIIRSTPFWHGGPARRNCVFIVEDEDLPGMKGMTIAQVRLFLRFQFKGTVYPCVLIDRFVRVGRASDLSTGLWRVKPEKTRAGRCQDLLSNCPRAART